MSVTIARSPLIDPATLAAIDDLRLVARLIVEGFLAGEHPDRRPGAGVEFSQYRSYEPGDDLRRVDWRAYARSDRLLVREAEVERDITVRLVVDATASMAHRDGPLSKLDYARLVAAAIAWLADQQGDRVALHAVSDERGDDLPPQRGRRSLLRVLHHLSSMAPAGRWPPWSTLGQRVGNPREREMIVLLSDLYDPDGEIDVAIRHWIALGHEVLVLHLLARNEIDFTFTGDLSFQDLESGARVDGSAEAMRTASLAKLAATIDEWRERLLAAGGTYESMATDRPVDGALRALLLRRQRLP